MLPPRFHLHAPCPYPHRQRGGRLAICVSGHLRREYRRLTYHYREAEDENAARAELEEVARRASEAGFDARWGRKVLEIRPAVEADKGTAVRALVERTGARLGLYAGDDTTDLDGFAGLRSLGLEHAVCVAVASAEGPAELLEAADLVVAGPEELAGLLRLL